MSESLYDDTDMLPDNVRITALQLALATAGSDFGHGKPSATQLVEAAAVIEAYILNGKTDKPE